jgi:hypothetical protein
MSPQAKNPKQLQTDSGKVDGKQKEQPTSRKSKDQSNPPPYPVIPAPSAVIDISVNPKPPTPSDADQPLPSLPTLHAQLKEIAQKYRCCYRQIIAAREVLRKDFDVKRTSQQRALTSTKKLEPTLLKLVKTLAAAGEVLRKDFGVKRKSQRVLTSTEKLEPTLGRLVNALTDLDKVQWKGFLFEPLQRNTASDIGKVLQDLDSFVGEVNKFLEYLRFLAFHAELVWKDAAQLIGPQAPDAIYLQQVCQRLEGRVKGVNTLLTGEAKE